MRVHAIETGRVRVKPSQLVGRGHGLARRLLPIFDRDWTDWLPVYAYAIEHADGVILVDSGANEGLESLPRWHPYFQRSVRFEIDREQEIGPRLAALGVGSRDVKTIVLTHLHIDHDGGLEDFPHARVFVAAGELAATRGLAGRVRGYLPQRWPSGFDPEPIYFADKPFGPFTHSRRLTEDGAVVALPTPGHTPHHLCVALVEEDSTLLFAGDASYSLANLVARRIDGVSADEPVAAATLDKLNAFAAERPVVFLPAHDPGAAERLARRSATSRPA